MKFQPTPTQAENQPESTILSRAFFSPGIRVCTWNTGTQREAMQNCFRYSCPISGIFCPFFMSSNLWHQFKHKSLQLVTCFSLQSIDPSLIAIHCYHDPKSYLLLVIGCKKSDFQIQRMPIEGSPVRFCPILILCLAGNAMVLFP